MNENKQTQQGPHSDATAVSPWFRVCSWSKEIEEVVVERYTDHSVWVLVEHYGKVSLERRLRNRSDRYFPTREEAVNHVRDITEREMKSLQGRMDRLKARLDKLDG